MYLSTPIQYQWPWTDSYSSAALSSSNDVLLIQHFSTTRKQTDHCWCTLQISNSKHTRSCMTTFYMYIKKQMPLYKQTHQILHDDLLHVYQETDAFVQAEPASHREQDQADQRLPTKGRDMQVDLHLLPIFKHGQTKKSAPSSVKLYIPLCSQVFWWRWTVYERRPHHQSLQQEILTKIHTAHQGITKCQDRGRQ